MEQFLASLLDALPAIGFAAYIVTRQQAVIERLLENQQKLIEQLMSLHPPQSKEDAKNTSQTGS